MTLTGAIYAPNAQIVYDGGNSVTQTPTCTVIVAKTIQFATGASWLDVSGCGSVGLSNTLNTLPVVQYVIPEE